MSAGEFSISTLFAANLTVHGDRPALLMPGGRIVSYRELAERVDRQASQWRGRRGLAMIEADLSEHAVVAYLAALKAGHAVAMQSLNSMDADRQILKPEFCYSRFDGRWRLERLEGATEALHPDLAVLLSTSGSTGHGKCVRLSAANIQSNAQAIAAYLGLTASDRSCLVLPIHYSYGLSVLNAHLAVGASVYVPGGSILDEAFLDGLAKSGSTNLSGVPYSYDLLEKVGFRERDFPDLRFMTVAGGRPAPEMIRRYNEHLARRGALFFAMYGQTEATARIAYVPPDRLAGREDRIGIAISGGSLTIEDDQGRLIAAAETPGELVYRGPNVMMGYAGSRADLARGAELAELRTGDLAVRDAEGFFRIVGRTKRISKIAGLRIGHDSLEAALERRGIAAAVIGDDACIHAFYAATPGSGRPSPEEVRRILVAASGLTLMQIKVSCVDELPRLPSGKVDYRRLQDQAEERVRTDHGDGIASLFDQLFYPKKVQPGDSFLSLGGDSLRFVQLSVGLEKVLGEVPEAWEKMTVATLATLQKRETKGRQIGSDLMIRALAILLVVLHHETLWPIPGGSAAMVILAGFGLARFQVRALLSGAVLQILRPLGQILVPYYLIVAGYALGWGQVPWASVFLVGNFGFADPERHDMVPYLYWFIEAYCQMLVVFAAVFAVPFVRRAGQAKPFAVGMMLFAAALAARLALPLFVDIGNRQIFALPWVFYLAVLGWCAAVAETTFQRVMLMLAGTGAFLFFGLYEGVWIGTKIKYLLQIVVLATLLFLPRIRVPKWAIRMILPLSAAGFHIYLLHRFVPELLLLPMRPLLSPTVYSSCALVGGVGLGLVIWTAHQRLLQLLARSEGRRRPLDALRQLAGRLRFGRDGFLLPQPEMAVADQQN